MDKTPRHRKRFLLLLLGCLMAFSLKAQTVAADDYWDDVDFTDTTLVSTKALSDKLINYLYQFTAADEKDFDIPYL